MHVAKVLLRRGRSVFITGASAAIVNVDVRHELAAINLLAAAF
jgi:hypothetical protein